MNTEDLNAHIGRRRRDWETNTALAHMRRVLDLVGPSTSLMVERARVAYLAYGAFTGGVNHRGEPMPAWEDLPEPIRQAWVAAATAVVIAAGGPEPSDE